MSEFACEGCGQAFRVNDGLAGKRVACKRCATPLVVPGPDLTPIPLAPRPVSAPEVAPRRPETRRKKKRKPGTVDRDAWVALAIGLGMALIAMAVPLVGFVIHVLTTVIHELGHTATAWLFASPAVPSFDLNYGGGYSYRLARQPWLMVLAYLAWGYFLYRERDNRPRLIAMLVGIGLYSIVMFSPLHDALIVVMGHGTELIFAEIFLHRALSGNQILRSEERPLYAFLGIYLVLYDVRFAFQLMTDHSQREAYGEAKGGGHQMDFDRIAHEALNTSLATVAALFLIACLLTPVSVWLLHRYRHLLPRVGS